MGLRDRGTEPSKVYKYCMYSTSTEQVQSTYIPTNGLEFVRLFRVMYIHTKFGAGTEKRVGIIANTFSKPYSN